MQMAEDIATLKKEFAQVTESVKLLEADANAASTSMDEATLRKTLGNHAAKLADLFNKKASLDDIGTATAALAATMEKKMAEVAAAASKNGGGAVSIGTSADGCAQTVLAMPPPGLGASFGGLGIDKTWVKTLVSMVRTEAETMRHAGGGPSGALSSTELDRQLHNLEARLADASGLTGEGGQGTAIFRCIACDQPLPDDDEPLSSFTSLNAAGPVTLLPGGGLSGAGLASRAKSRGGGDSSSSSSNNSSGGGAGGPRQLPPLSSTSSTRQRRGSRTVALR